MRISKLLEQNKNLTAFSTCDLDAKTIYITSPYIQYEQLKLNYLYKQYVETASVSKKDF